MKKTIILFSLVSIILIATVVAGIYMFMPPKPVLVFDLVDNTNSFQKIAKKFRVQNSLRISASGQFSAEQLKRLLNFIPVGPQNTWIIDLRQESHGFINGMPVSWYGNKNSGNINLSPDEVISREQKLLETIRHKSSVTIYTIKKLSDGEISGENPDKIVVDTVSSEQQLVHTLGAKYKRLFVLDHHKPDDQTIDNFVNFVSQEVKPGDWLHFHCRGGKGRASTFMAMYDILLNAKQASFAAIMQHQISIGNIDLSQISSEPGKLWKANAAKERQLFLQRFYDYVNDPHGYGESSWSSWSAVN